jgi:hypothetical protein
MKVFLKTDKINHSGNKNMRHPELSLFSFNSIFGMTHHNHSQLNRRRGRAAILVSLQLATIAAVFVALPPTSAPGPTDYLYYREHLANLKYPQPTYIVYQIKLPKNRLWTTPIVILN